MTTRRFTLISAALIVAAIVLAHGRGLRGEWIGADRGIVDRSPLAAHSVSTAPAEGGSASLATPSWIAEATAALSLAADRAVWGASSPAFRTSSRVLHGIAALLLFAFVLQWTRVRAASLLAALVFAVHPVAVEALDTTAGRGQILAAALSFLSMIFLGRARSAAPSRAARGLSLGLALLTFVAASFASAIALVLPGAILAHDIALAAAGGTSPRRRTFEWGVFAVAGLPAVVAALVLAPPPPPRVRSLAGRALLEAFRILALPSPLDYYRILGLPNGTGFGTLLAIAGGGAAVSILLALALARRSPSLALLTNPASGPWARAAIASVPVLWMLLVWTLGAPGPVLAVGLVLAAILLATLTVGARAAGPREQTAAPTALAVALIVLPCLALVLFPPSGPGSDVPFPLLDHRLYFPAAGMGLLLGLFLFGGSPAAEARAAAGAGSVRKHSAPSTVRVASSAAATGATPGGPAAAHWLAAAALVVSLAAASAERHGIFTTEAVLYATTAATSPSSELRVLLAHSAAARGQGEKAIEVVKRLIVKEPESAPLHLLLANLLRDLRDLDASEAEAQAALRIDPTLGAAQLTLGLIARERGDAARAEEAYREAIRLDPRLDEAYSNLGAMLTARGATAEALKEMKRAVEIDPANGDAAANLASLLLEQKLVDEAITVARRGLELSSGNPRLHHVLGVALQRKGDPDGAARAYEESMRLAPTYTRPRLNLASIYGDQHRYDEAAALLARVLELEPNNERAHYSLGMVYRESGKTDLAAAEFHAALRIRPDYIEANRALTNLFSGRAPARGAAVPKPVPNP